MNELERIIKWYDLTLESQRFTIRLAEKSPEIFPLDSSLAAKSFNEVKETLLEAEKELKDLTVLSLVSVFEQILIDYVSDETKKIIEMGNESFFEAAIKYAFKNTEKWHFKDILDLFKTMVGSELVGRVKQIYEYRNWVAHGKNQSKINRVTKTTPEITYEQLSEFLNRLNKG